MNGNFSRTRWLAIAGFLVLAANVGDARDKKAARLATQAKKAETSVKGLWKKFVFEPDKLTDKETSTIVNKYEKAVDLYQKSLEVEEDAGINGVILVLARRIARGRMLEMARAPKTAGSEGTAGPQLTGLPELVETKAQRRRGIQGVRNFIMHYYFANRKAASLRSTCHRCNGAGQVATATRKKSGGAITLGCATCSESGLVLNENALRKGFWLCNSPLYRADGQKQFDWMRDLQLWRENPRRIPECLTKLRIVSVEYHGLWADVKVKEEGRTRKDWPFSREVTHRVIRAGKRWFFHDEKLDRDFFVDKDTSDGRSE